MPTVDFWLDWTIDASVDELRALLPSIAAAGGYAIEETISLATAPEWATFAIRAPEVGPEPIGTGRAQSTENGRSQVFVAPGAARDEAALRALNRATLHLYCQLLLRGLLTPPPPFDRPDPPFPPLGA